MGFRSGSGLFGVAGHSASAQLTASGLVDQGGDGAAAIAVSDGHVIRRRTALRSGGDGMDLGGLNGTLALGQVARRAVGDARFDHGVPLALGRYRGGEMAAALIGHFTNGTRLRRELAEAGALFATSSDAEVLLHLVAHSAQRTFVNRLVDALWRVEGAFSALVLGDSRLVAIRDPRGFRPLVLGRIGDAVAVSTDDAALALAGAAIRREVQPGEMVICDGTRTQTVTPFPQRNRAACIHEFVEVARTDARVFGQDTYAVRVGLGSRLAREQPCEQGSVVVGLPGPAEAFAVGYARVVRCPCEPGVVVTGGSSPRLRVVPAVVAERAVVLVVASMVTGERIRRVTGALYDAGATAVHLRVGAPPVRRSCVYGVQSPTTDELAAATHPVEDELVAWLGVTSVGFLSEDGLHAVVGRRVDARPMYCDACFSGDFPVPPEEPDDQLPLF